MQHHFAQSTPSKQKLKEPNTMMNMNMLTTLTTVKVKASWDTQQRLPYYPNSPRRLKKPSNLKPTNDTTTAVSTPSTTTATVTLTPHSVTNLLKKPNTTTHANFDDTYLGYEIWLPAPPKVEKPRSVYNAATLAYVGDTIFELYSRRHFLYPPLSIEEYNDRVRAVVRCEAQDAMLQKLINENYLSQEERDVLRWGKNIVSAKTRAKKRVGVAAYNRASALETLVGYLYLTNVKRLEEIMQKLGFSTDSSTQTDLEGVTSTIV